MIITDKLRSYSAAKAEVLPGVELRQDKGQSNRTENSHQPTRLRERVMRQFKSTSHGLRSDRFWYKASPLLSETLNRFNLPASFKGCGGSL